MFQSEVTTVFTIKKAKEISKEAITLDRRQDMLLNVLESNDMIYEGQVVDFKEQTLIKDEKNEYCKSHNVEIITLEEKNNEDLNKEMVEDMISIITSFSARIYGSRGGRKAKETLDELEKAGENN